MDWVIFVIDDFGIWMFFFNCWFGCVIVYKLIGFDGRMYFVISFVY